MVERRFGCVMVVLAAMAGTACGRSGRDASPLPPQGAASLRVSLQSFSGESACADLERYIEDTAVLQMRSQLEQWKAGGPADPLAAEGGAGAAPPAADASAAPRAPAAYTTTNTQVAGVDEADFVKNDGTRVFALAGDTLYAARSWPAQALAVAGKLRIEGWPREMFLDGDRLVVFSAIYAPHPLDAGDVICAGLHCGYAYANEVKVSIVDVSDLAAPRLAQQVYLPGTYVSARRVGSAVRVVLSDAFRYPAATRWYPDVPTSVWTDRQRLADAYDALMAANEKLIREQTLAGWIPSARVVPPGGAPTELPRDCTAFHRTTAPTKLGVVTVATLDLADPDQLSRTSVVGEVAEVYASARSLYVANPHWWWWPAPGQGDVTYLHKFDITRPDRAVYVASGGVEGQIVDQFSMDEDASGFFRIATTIATRVEDPTFAWGRIETTNRVQVLAETGGALEVVGRSEELAKGERIYSSRFLGERGYVVTFRQIDPLFTFDLSDPRNPRKVGELKVPGFSTYLHPLDQDHLLAIGTYVPENTTDWRARAVQLSVFDVSDPGAPRQKYQQLVGTAYGWSEAQYDHKAFNWFPERKLLAIPFVDWSPASPTVDGYWSSFVTELRVFQVDTATGITPRGALSMKDLYLRESYPWGWTYSWSPAVRRSVMADQYVYAISDAGIRVGDVQDLGHPLATALFERAVAP